MAQAGFTPISLYYSTTASAVPLNTNLVAGELALNTLDEKLYFKNSAGTVKLLASNATSAPVLSFSAGTTGFTPSTATSGAITLAGTLVAANGGTGQSSYAVGDLLYASTTTALSKLADVATGSAIISGGVGVAPSYGKIGLTTHVSGTLPVGNGGTGITTTPTNGQIPIGNGTNYVAATLTQGTGITITNASGAITIAASGAAVSAATPTVAGTVYANTNSATAFQTFLGYQAGNVVTGVNNTLVGYQAGLLTTSGTNNTAVGFQALDAVTTGGSNTAIGSNALGAATTSTDNVAIGRNSLSSLTTGFGANVAIGTSALATATTADSNIAIGYQALNANSTASSNIGIGQNALVLATGANNVAIGVSALPATTTAANNVAVGFQAAYSKTSGEQNVYVGNQAGNASTGANSQVSIGYQAGQSSTGNSNTYIGYQAAQTATSGTNNITIGASADVSSATVSNEVTIGNTSIVSTRLRGMVELNAAMLEAATISATAATGTINYDARTQSVLYYTSNASANWTLNIRASSTVTLNTAMSIGESMTVAFLVTNGATAYYQTGFQVDGTAVTPKWQGGTAPTSGNASSIDTYVITVIKTASATFTVLASQTKFA
jgi:hypothetical protein